MTTGTIAKKLASSPIIVWTEERVQAAIIEYLFTQDSPQSFYQIRVGTGIAAYCVANPAAEPVSIFPALAKLRATYKIWRQDGTSQDDAHYALSLSTWLKLAEKRQAAKRRVAGKA